jgi:hypothetical protein
VNTSEDRVHYVSNLIFYVLSISGSSGCSYPTSARYIKNFI